RLLGEWRTRIVEEAASAGTDLLLTYVWGLELAEDAIELARYIHPYVERGAEVAFVELVADLDTRLRRNRTELRLAEKRSKRDVAWSDSNVREMERFVMNTDAGADHGQTLPGAHVLAQHPHLRLDNTDLTPQAAAERILGWLDAPAKERSDRAH
ncbi:MAG TPA: hypothetical protein VK039_07965, partial [Brevibacterium sp.]|nr:hypothetical protein [Brevibacterium sp.]